MTSQEVLRETMIAKHGTYEAYCQHMSAVGRKGGSRKVRKGYALRPELVRECGRKGGIASGKSRRQAKK